MFFAKNKMNAKDLFSERKAYKDLMEYHKYDTDFIDTWYEHYLYGITDHAKNAVYPSEAFLKSISQNQREKHYLVNFAADMFNDLVEFWNSLVTTGKLNTNESEILIIEPVSAWKSVHTAYHTYMEALFVSFAKYIRREEKNRPTSQEDMVEKLKAFLVGSKNFKILTKSSFITSKYCDPKISGLFVDVKDYDYDKDRFKWDFMVDPNFSAFKNAAEQYGFKLDKNVPWKLVVDLDSPVTARYMKKYGVTYDNIYKRYYYRAFLFDIQNLETYTNQFWNQIKKTKLNKKTLTDANNFFNQRGFLQRAPAKIEGKKTADNARIEDADDT